MESEKERENGECRGQNHEKLRTMVLGRMTALIIGGTHGIGHAVVKEVAEFGARVYSCSRNEAELSKCLKQWQDKGFLVFGSVCGLSSPEERVKLIQQMTSAINGKLKKSFSG